MIISDNVKAFLGAVVLVVALSVGLTQTDVLDSSGDIPQTAPRVLDSSLTPAVTLAQPALAPPQGATITAAPTPALTGPGTPITSPFDLPILMYHRVFADPALVEEDPDSAVTLATFEEQMAYLRCAGFTTLTPSQLLAIIAGDIAMPQRPVLLTFDDGFAEHYSAVFPSLRANGHVAAFAIVTGFVGSGDMYVTWDQVREMSAAGMEMMNHTVNHAGLVGIDEADARWQIEQAKADLEAAIGRPAPAFVYPGGEPFRSGDEDQQAAVLRMLYDAGHTAALRSDEYAMAQDPRRPYELHRMRVFGYTDLPAFAASLYGPPPTEAACP